MMQAAWYERTGPAGEVLQLGELETPRPRPGEDLVRVFASGINPSDTKMRALAQIAQAHESVEQHRVIGNVVLRID